MERQKEHSSKQEEQQRTYAERPGMKIQKELPDQNSEITHTNRRKIK